MGNKFEVSGSTGAVDFKKKGTVGLVVEQGASDPGSPTTGQLFFRTDLNALEVSDSLSFKAIMGGSFRVYGELASLVSGTTYAVAVPFTPGTTQVSAGGSTVQRVASSPAAGQYTENSPLGQITFGAAPASPVLVSYSRLEGSTLPLINRFDVVTGTPLQTYNGSTTVFNLPFIYRPGSGSLLVTSGGVLMLPVGDYAETNANTVTFNSPRTNEEVIEFIKLGVANDFGGKTRTISGATAISAAGEETLLIDASSGPVTVTLPLAASALDHKYYVKKTDSSGNGINIIRSGSDLIDGATFTTVSAQYQRVALISNGSGWWIL